MDRIKGLRQKQANGTFASLVPFGTDGNLVDMSSGLNNEEELKLGGNHEVSIVTNNDVTTVTELYYDDNNNIVLYTVESIITPNANNTTIITSLWEGSKSGIAARVKTTTIPTIGNITEVLS